MYLRKRGHLVSASWKLQVTKQLAYALNYLVSVPMSSSMDGEMSIGSVVWIGAQEGHKQTFQNKGTGCEQAQRAESTKEGPCESMGIWGSTE